MRTLFAKILLWFWCTLAIFVVGSAFISALSVNRNASDQQAPGDRLVKFQLEEARVSYETGGRPALRRNNNPCLITPSTSFPKSTWRK